MIEGEKMNFRVLERLVRGFSNHRRIQILFLLEKKPELSVGEITDELKINLKTAAAHIRTLTIAGLVMKKSRGVEIHHRLTDRAEQVIKFLRILAR